MYHVQISSPVGHITIGADDTAITEILFENQIPPEGLTLASEYPPHLATCMAQLEAYFAGSLQQFDVPIRHVGTPFQLRVWGALHEIPFGETWSYLALSRFLGDEKAIRAVGTTNGKNRINIITPCHRVVGANGQLTGYGGELWRKDWLLRHERRLAKGVLELF